MARYSRRDTDQSSLGKFSLSRRRDRSSWYITWFDPKSKQTRRKTTGTGNLEQAQRALAEHFQQHEQLCNERPEDVPLMVILDRYYEEHGRYLPSRKSVSSAIAIFRTYFGNSTVSEFRRKDQERFIRELQDQGKSTGYVSRIMSVAKAALNRARANEELSAVPAFVPLKRGAPRRRVLAATEVAALFNAAKESSQFWYLLLAICTGARPSAILELTREQVDTANKLVHLDPPGRDQTKKRRPVVPMVTALARWVSPIASGYLVHHDGKPYSYLGWKAIFRRLVKRAGLQGVSPYTLRHTVATVLATKGVPMQEIAAFMGHHSQGGTTGLYVHYSPAHMRQLVEALDAYVSELAPLVNCTLLGSKVGPEASDRVHLRAHNVPMAWDGWGLRGNFLRKNMVGVTGFEPATYTSRT
jgi:integrase